MTALLLFSLFFSKIAPGAHGDPVIVLQLKDVDLRGERETKFYPREPRILPILCKERKPLTYHIGARQFIDRNEISTFSGPGAAKSPAEVTDSKPECISVYERPEASIPRGIQRHFQRGTDHPVNQELAKYEYDSVRKETLLVWVEEQSHSMAYNVLFLLLGKSGLTDDDHVNGFEWVTVYPYQLPYVSIKSVSNPLQSVSLQFE